MIKISGELLFLYTILRKINHAVIHAVNKKKPPRFFRLSAYPNQSDIHIAIHDARGECSEPNEWRMDTPDTIINTLA